MYWKLRDSPETFRYEERDWDLKLSYESGPGMHDNDYVLEINGQRIDELPRDLTVLNPDLVKRDLRARIYLNKKPVLLCKMPWTVELMHDRISKTIGNNYLTSIYLGGVAKYYEDVSKSVISEFVDLIS